MVSFRAATGLAALLAFMPMAQAQLFPSQDQRPNLHHRSNSAADKPTGSTFYAPPPDARSGQTLPYDGRPAQIPQPDGRLVPTQMPRSYLPQQFRGDRAIIPSEQKTNWQEHRNAIDRNTQDRNIQDRTAAEPRPPVQAPDLRPIATSPLPASPLQDARDLLNPDRRSQILVQRPVVTVAPDNRILDYKIPDRAPYDYRPLDYKPVDTRTTDYKSQDNKVPDQRVIDPRLKEKGPEINTRLDCRAILYRAAECNFIDYREPDPKMLELGAKYPEISIGIVPKDFSREAIDRWNPLIAHLSREVGLKISLKIANDYQALLESQRAGLIHIAIYSPVSFARARLLGSKIEAFAMETNADGSRGSHAMVYAMARGTNPKVEDLKGKTLGLVDPNSMTGFNLPRFSLNVHKIDPETFLGRQIFTGSHENALLALSQGLVDLAVGEWRSDEDSTLTRLLSKGFLKNVDGTAMRRDDFRIVLKTEAVPNAPVAYLADLPEDLKAILRRAVLEAPMRDRAAFEKVFDGKGQTWETVDTKAYDTMVDLVRYMEETRKKKPS